MNNIIIAKFGSELVTSDTGVDQERIDAYARGLVQAYLPSSLIVVTSGAVVTGRARLKDDIEVGDVTLAQLGVAGIVTAWESAFAKVGVLAGGLLVTHNELRDEVEGPQFDNALRQALAHSVVSIVNENDALSDDELMKLAVGGDNDGLAAHIAMSLQAKLLMLFTKNGGIVDESGSLIQEVNATNTLEIEAMLKIRSQGASQLSVGRGGMVSKFDAARRANSGGVEVCIAKPSPDMRGELITKFMVG